MNKTLLVLATLTGGALIAVFGAASAGEKALGQKTFKARKLHPCARPKPPKWCSGDYLYYQKRYIPKPHPEPDPEPWKVQNKYKNPDPTPWKGMDRLKNKAGQFRR